MGTCWRSAPSVLSSDERQRTGEIRSPLSQAACGLPESPVDSMRKLWECCDFPERSFPKRTVLYRRMLLSVFRRSPNFAVSVSKIGAMKRIFVIDWLMIASFVPSLWSGIGLHIAGHGTDIGARHGWTAFHVSSSLLFLVVAICHIATHRGWYEAIVRRGMGNKSRVTAVLSLSFAAVVITGVVLLGVSGAGPGVGMWHYRMGIVAGVLSVGHLLKRIPVLRKSFGR